jgi:hypothetical protein
MQNSQEILFASFMAVIVIELILASKKLIAAYASTLGDKKFNYSFNKAKMPTFVGTLVILAVLSFLYGLLIGGQVGLAAEFCGSVTLFGGIMLLVIICYVPRQITER